MWDFRKTRISSPSLDASGIHGGGHNSTALDHCIDKCDELDTELANLYARRNELESAVKAELEKLPPDECAVMMDRYVINTDATHEETAKRLGWSERQVRRFHEDALKRINIPMGYN